MNGTEWLSESGEKLFFELREQDLGPGAVHFDVVIVGSGYGGAVAAARLAGARAKASGQALKVLVLERGREIVPGAFPDRFAELPGEVRLNWHDDPAPKGRRDGLLDLRLGEHVSALLGNGLGGGSLINAGVLAHPAPSVFKAEPWPAALREVDLVPCFDRAKRMLGAARTPEPRPAKLSAIEAVGRELEPGIADRRAEIAVSFTAGTNEAGVFQQACIRCGDCFTGCNHWAKNTLAMNYLPLAHRRGARIATGVTVMTVRPAQSGSGWILELALTDAEVAERFAETQGKKRTPGAPRAGTVSSTIGLAARHVILAAGTFGSTEILLRSREKHRLSLSTQLGKRFSTNGDMIAIGHRMRSRVNASATETLAPDQRDVGPTITGMIDLRDSANPDLKGVVIEEMAVPAALRRLFEETVTTFGALHGLARPDWSHHSQDAVGQDPAAIDQTVVEHTAIYATMGDDRAGGVLELVPARGGASAVDGKDREIPAAGAAGDGGIRVQWENVAACDVFRRSMAALNQAHRSEAIGGTVIPYPLWKPLPEQLEAVLGNPAGKGSVFTVHPLGGCAMADAPSAGVVNALGQVFKGGRGTEVHDGLVVLDGSIMPAALGINPCLTIAGLAEHAVEALADIWGLETFEQNPQAKLLPLPAPPVLNSGARAIGPSRPTAIRLAERLQGTVKLPHGLGGLRRKAFEATLTIEFEPIPDLGTFVAQHPKVMPIAVARLVLEAEAPNLTPGDGGKSTTPASIALSGSMSLLQREDSGAVRRVVRAVWAWLWNRGLRDIWDGLKRGGGQSGGYWAKLKSLLVLASHAGEARRFVYELLVQEDLHHDGGVLLRRGDRLIGQKRLAYTLGANPWHQLTRLKLRLERAQGGGKANLGTIEVDPMHFVKANAVQLQLVAQENQPNAIADLLSFGAYLMRLIGNIHIWTFRAPDRPETEHRYEYPSAEAGVEGVCKERLPGDVPGIGAPEIWDRVPSQNRFRVTRTDGTSDEIELKGRAKIRLSRYRPHGGARKDLKPVLLFHGFGASGTTFTHPAIKTNLVQHLVGQGFDTWVVDLRTSIGLASSFEQWTFEDVAYGDVPAAIEKVREVTQAPSINVVAHCIGSAMFCMAALGGRLPRGSVHAAVLSQVGPLIQLPNLNRARGFFAGYLKYMLQWKKLDITTPRGPMVDIVDRLLGAYPYPDYEWSAHHPLAPWATIPHEVYCNRANAIFGRLFEHANLGRPVLDSLGDLLGHVNLRTFQQTMFYATKGRLTDHLGCSAYVNYKSISDYFRFPVCMIHGEKSEVFWYGGSQASIEMLQWIFGPERRRDAGRRASARQEMTGVPARQEMTGASARQEMIGATARQEMTSAAARRDRSSAAVRADMASEAARADMGSVVARHYMTSAPSRADMNRVPARLDLTSAPARPDISSAPTRETAEVLSSRVLPEETRLRFHLFEAYGHQDVFLGERAHEEVFPAISGFLLEHKDALPLKPNDVVRDVFRKPRLGPVVGWVRRDDPSAGGPGHLVANVMFVADDLRSAPQYALTIVLSAALDARGRPQHRPDFAKLHQLQTIASKLLPYATQAEISGGKPLVVAQTVEVELPGEPDDYFVLVVTVHQEPALAADDDDPANFPWAAVDHDQWMLKDPGIGAGRLTRQQFERYVEPVLAACDDNDLRAELCPLGRRVVDEDYERNTTVAVLSKACLEAAGPAAASVGMASVGPEGALVFAAGSCRYAASVFDREIADRCFGRLRDLLLACPPGRRSPQLLLLTGDQIYADATAGLFDPTSGLDRFDHRYLEAWSAPNAREVLRRLPTYMMLDDHEVQDNWEQEALLERGALYAFDAYQRKLAPPNPVGKQSHDDKHAPFWYEFSSGGYGFFVADTRTERQRASGSDRLEDRIMGERQMQALQQWLRNQNTANPARPKFVVSPGVIAPWMKVAGGCAAYALRSDGWDSFPGSLNTLLSFIAEQEIPNVVFLCGDYHASMVCEMGLRVGNGPPVKAYSIVSSGFYAPYPFANAFPDVLQLSYSGSHAAWLGAPGTSSAKLNQLQIDYSTRSLLNCDAFAVVAVSPRDDEQGAKQWDMTIEFDGEDGVTRTAILLSA